MSTINPIITTPLCRQGYSAVIVCISEKCGINNPFICANCATEPCYIDHAHCRKELYQTFLERLTQNRPKSQGLTQLQACIFKLYTNIAKLMEESKSAFVRWLRECYYSDKVKQLINHINDNRFGKLTGSQMHEIYQEAVYNPKQTQFKFTKYFNKKTENILAFVRVIQQNIASIYNEKVNPKSLDMESFSMSFGSDITFDMGRKEPPRRDNRDRQEVNWKALQHQKEVNLQHKLKQQNQFAKLQKADFTNTIVIRLSNNNITNLSWIKGLVFPSLHELCLDYNMIEDISPLEKMFFPLLKGLYLEYNQISDISPLTKVHAPYLQTLNLNYNQIESIQPLPQCQFQELKKLYLHDNNISNAVPLLRMKHTPKIELITLQANNLPYESEDFKKLIVTIKSRFLKCTVRAENSESFGI